MKILIVNNYYYYRGGDCTYLFSLKKVLEEKGHQVIIFAMHHPQNFESDYSKYFVSYINYDEEVKDVNMASGLKVLNRTVYSQEAKNNIERLILTEKPDIAHIQNIHHHITPSIFCILKKHNVPIIWTLHDYTIICPNTSFLSHGKVCEKCKISKYYWPPIERCKKDSFSASTMAALESTLHAIMRFKSHVDVFIAPSRFLRDKIIEYGFDKEKVVQLNYFTDFQSNNESEATEDYYLYVGRISMEKGLKTLVDAAVEVNRSRLLIAGNGQMLDEMIEYARSKDKNNIVEFLGFKDREELRKLYENCKFLVVPSEWYETSGLIIFEAFVCSKPVIGARIGGIPELVKDTERGLLFETGDKDDLSAAIRYMLDNPDLVQEMGKNANEFVNKELRGDLHYKKLMEIYERTCALRK